MPSLRSNSLAAMYIKGSLLAKVGRLYRAAGKYRTTAAVNRDLLEDLLQTAIRQGTVSSNGMEGITLDADRYHAIMVKHETPIGRPEQVVAGYRDALDFIHRNHEQIEVTPETIQDLCRRMYAHTSDVVGPFRKERNVIERQEPGKDPEVVFVPPPHEMVERHIKDLCTSYHRLRNDPDTDPFVLLAAWVFDFTCIHPYADGNGRLSRLLTTLLSYQLGFDVVRYISLERIIYETKSNYYWSLTRSSQQWDGNQHDLSWWIGYLADTYLKAYEELEDRIQNTKVRGFKTERIQQTIDALPSRFTLSDVRDACPGVSHALIVGVLKTERDAGRLETVGKGPKAYYRKVSTLDKTY